MSSILYDTGALRTALENAIICWNDTESYRLDDMKFIEKVCNATGMSKEDYVEIML